MDMTRLQETLTKHEGCKLELYRCTSNKLTIGIGRNIEDNGISMNTAKQMLVEDIGNCIEDLQRNVIFFNEMPEVVKEALVNMVFNMGITRFLQFKNTLRYLKEKKYKKAGDECLNSRWAQQVGYRALEVAQQIKNGG